MKKITRTMGILVIMMALIPQKAVYATKHIVNVQNFLFSPANLPGVFVGDTVRWVWINGSHTTTSTTIPIGAATWDSPLTTSIRFFEYRITVPGVYNYHCTPHADMGMTGSFTAIAPPTLTVTPPNQDVGSPAGSTSFTVTTTANWTAVSNQTWCTVTPSGSGNGSITANYTENTLNFGRVASITVTVTGISPVVVSVSQSPPLNKTLNLTLYLEGLFNGTNMNQAQNSSGNQFPGTTADQVNIELHNATPPYSLAGGPFLANAGTEGTASVTIPGALNGNYYIVIKHRNSIETWNASPVSFGGSLINYDFSTGAAQAYGGNLKPIGEIFAIYGGDVNQDGQVDLGDMTPVDNDAINFVSGYVISDVNGDGIVDIADFTILDNNSSGFTGVIAP